jgi:hypothetical protein
MIVVIVVIVVMVMVVTVVMIMMLVLLAALFVPLLAALFVPLLATLLVSLFRANRMLLMSKLFVPQSLVPLALPGANVLGVILTGLHEIHLAIARVILVTMQAPSPGVLRRNMQVKRLRDNNMRCRLLNDHRLRIDQRRRRPATEVHAAIDSRRDFAVNRHSDIHIRIGSGGSERQSR